MDDLDLSKIAAAVERGETFGPQTMRQLIALARRDGVSGAVWVRAKRDLRYLNSPVHVLEGEVVRVNRVTGRDGCIYEVACADGELRMWGSSVFERVPAPTAPGDGGVTADAVRNTITRFLTADDPTHWGEFEKRLAVAVGMTPSTAEDASMAGGSDAGGGDEFMVGPRGGMESRTTPAKINAARG
jgi:hypothetical protein